MPPTTTEPRSDDLFIDQPEVKGEPSASTDGVASTTLIEPLFDKDSATLGATLPPLQYKRGGPRSSARWAVPLILVALAVAALAVLHQHRIGDARSRGLPGETTPDTSPAQQSR